MTSTPNRHISDQMELEDLRFALGLTALRPWKQTSLDKLTLDQRDAIEQFVLIAPQNQSSIFIYLADRYLALDEDPTEVESAQASSLRHLLALLEEHGDPATFILPENALITESLERISDSLPADLSSHGKAETEKEKTDWTLAALVGIVSVSLIAGVFATIRNFTRR